MGVAVGGKGANSYTTVVELMWMPKQLTIPLASLAVHGPVVVAVIVHRSLAVE